MSGAKIFALALSILVAFGIGFGGARLLPDTEPAPKPPAPVTGAPVTPSHALSDTPRLATSESLRPKLAFIRSLARATPEDYPRLLARYRATGQHEAALIINTWAKTDPAACFETLIATGDEKNASGFHPLRALFREWARHDPDTAVAAALDHRLGEAQQELALRQLFSSLLNHDTGRAFALIEKTLTDRPYLDFSPSFQQREWLDGAGDPGALAARLDALPDSEFRSIALRQCVRKWFDTDPAAAATWLATTDAQDNWSIASSLINKWVGADPAGAAQYVSENIVGENRSSIISEVAERWALQDPEAAFAWVANETFGGARHNALNSLFYTLGRENPEAAVALLQQIPDLHQRHGATTALLRTWTNQHPLKALDWVRENVNEHNGRQNQALIAIAGSWSGANATWASKESARMLAENPDALPVSFVSVVAYTYGTKHPDRAVDWALELPEAHAKVALVEALDDWMTRHPEAAARHALEQTPPDHPRRALTLDAITQLYVENHDPDALGAFIDSLTSPEKRAQP